MEYLFNRYRMYDYQNAILENVAKSINHLTLSSFQNNSVDDISKSIFDHHNLTTPVLKEDGKFQRVPKDIKISMPTRSRYDGYVDIQGTRFEIVIPFTGDKDLFQVCPNVFNSNPPAAVVTEQQLHFIYEIPSNANKDEVYVNFDKNLNNIKNWLNYTEQDVLQFNSKLNTAISSEVGKRKQKIDDDNNAANSSGIPIR